MQPLDCPVFHVKASLHAPLLTTLAAARMLPVCSPFAARIPPRLDKNAASVRRKSPRAAASLQPDFDSNPAAFLPDSRPFVAA